MRFVDLLKTATLASAAAASALAFVTVLETAARADDRLVYFAGGWWLVAALIGGWIGRRAEPSPSVTRALREARAATSLPEQRPAWIALGRLWPLLLAMVAAAGLSAIWPQIAAIAAGFGIIWALSWRHQESAVTAIEERDGVSFFVANTSPVGEIKLVRAPGLRRDADPAVI